MRKSLLLTCALALFAIVGVSAQNWCRTLAAGTAGEPLENNQYRAETALIENAGAKGVRYTVMQTGSTNQIKGGGPTFALGEMIVLSLLSCFCQKLVVYVYSCAYLSVLYQHLTVLIAVVLQSVLRSGRVSAPTLCFFNLFASSRPFAST